MKAEEYLKEMSKEVHNRDVRDCIIQEYRDHLDDAIEALMEKGMSEAEAEEEGSGKWEIRKWQEEIWDVCTVRCWIIRCCSFSGGWGFSGVSPSGHLRIRGIPSPSRLVCLMECRRQFFIFSA